MTNQRVKLPQPLRNLVVTVLAVCAIGACGGGGGWKPVLAKHNTHQHWHTFICRYANGRTERLISRGIVFREGRDYS